MKVMDYVSENPSKASYTIRVLRKSYLCNAKEAVEVFGDYDVQKITFNHGSKSLPVLHL